MDRITLRQLDEVHALVKEIHGGVEMLLDEEQAVLIKEFLEEFVYSDDGELKHLKTDAKLRAFYTERFGTKEFVSGEEYAQR